MKRLNFLLIVSLFFLSNGHAQDDFDFKNVKTFLAKSVEDETVAGGSAMVFVKGEIVFQAGFGYADVESKLPFQFDTPVVIASISKPILGTGIHRFAESGKLDLNAPITKYLPEFKGATLESGKPIKRAPTVIELLTHTSGLRNDEAPKGRIWYQDWTRNQPLEVVVSRVATDFPFHSQPGTKSAYSGIGTDVAARIAKVVSGNPRNDFLLNQVCEPLGMTHTYYRDTERISELSMPTRYIRNEKTGKLVPWKRKRPAPAPYRYNSSGGSVISTAPDLARWLLMLRNEGVHEGQPYVTPETYTQILTPHTPGKNVNGGLFIRKKDKDGNPIRYGHTGSSGTNVWIDFETDVIGIVLTQTSARMSGNFRIDFEKQIKAALTK